MEKKKKELTVADIGKAIAEAGGPGDLRLGGKRSSWLGLVGVEWLGGAHRDPGRGGVVTRRRGGGVGEFLIVGRIGGVHDWIGSVCGGIWRGNEMDGNENGEDRNINRGWSELNESTRRQPPALMIQPCHCNTC